LLRDASAEDAERLPEPLSGRVRHVVSENARVLSAVDALAQCDYERLGALFVDSHASLRDDYHVSTPELDALVAAFTASGAYGARLTGAGFGGCVVGIASVDDAADVMALAADRYRRETNLTPTVWLCRPARGAGPLPSNSEDL
jgi:galactokinase